MIPTREELCELYTNQRLTSRQIAEIFNTNKTYVLRWLKNYNIQTRLSHTGFDIDVKRPSKEELYKFVHVQFLSLSEIGSMYNVDRTAVHYWLKKYNIPAKPQYLNRSNIPSKNDLIELYLNSNMSSEQIGAKFNLPRKVITNLLAKYEIEIRPSGFTGRRFACKHGHDVQSSYELAVDNWLFENNIDHEYEPLITSNRRLKADFYANGLYIEVWGISKSPKYAARKQEKIALYKELNLELLEISWHDFATKTNERWKHKLEAEFGFYKIHNIDVTTLPGYVKLTDEELLYGLSD